MKKIDLAFCINNAYTNHLVVTLYSLLKNNKKSNITAHILSSDLTEESKKAIESLCKYHSGLEVRHYDVKADKFKKLSITMGYITLETYYRLQLSEILPKTVKKVLYLDADILVVGNVVDVFNGTNLDDLYGAAVPDIYLENDSEYKLAIGIGNSTYFNAGVFLFNLDFIRKNRMSNRLLQDAKKTAHKYQDQDALNVTFKNKIAHLDKRFNYQIKDKDYKEIPTESITILHYSGSFKPWNRDRHYDAFSEIYDRYKFEAARLVQNNIDNVKYGLLKYSTDNVGDSIQGIAARRFLPKIDYYFERDNTDETRTLPGEVVKLIINGWWGDGPENWPPLDQNLQILPISMYVEDRIQAEFKKPRSVEFLNAYGPVGARSRGTNVFLDSIGVNNFFSGCMTLTLNPDKRIKKDEFVLAVDVSDEIYERMKTQTSRKIIRIGVLRQVTDNVEEQMRLAELYLYLYQSAHSVVTTRLHTMLPCLALETPVLFINDILHNDDVRFSGLSELSRQCGADQYIKNPKLFNIDKPPLNKKSYRKIRSQLVKMVGDFTGFVSSDSFLSREPNELFQDRNLLQALVGGSSKLGDVLEELSIVNRELEHKKNHVVELSAENDKLRKEISDIRNTKAWKATKPLRYIQSLRGHGSSK